MRPLPKDDDLLETNQQAQYHRSFGEGDFLKV